MAGSRYGVEVRAAGAQDAAEVGRLLGLTAEAAAARLAALRGPGHAVLVATGWNALSGVAAVDWFDTLAAVRPVARLSILVVDPDDRRRGIGRLLLKAAAHAARAAGCEVMEAVPVSEAGEAFGHATGFEDGSAVMVRGLRRREAP